MKIYDKTFNVLTLFYLKPVQGDSNESRFGANWYHRLCRDECRHGPQAFRRLAACDNSDLHPLCFRNNIWDVESGEHGGVRGAVFRQQPPPLDPTYCASSSLTLRTWARME